MLTAPISIAIQILPKAYIPVEMQNVEKKD